MKNEFLNYNKLSFHNKFHITFRSSVNLFLKNKSNFIKNKFFNDSHNVIHSVIFVSSFILFFFLKRKNEVHQKTFF